MSIIGDIVDAIGGGPVLTAGATLLGSIMNNNTAQSVAASNQAFSASQAASIYTRGAQDLANAGINPILAYSSPAGMAQAVTPNIQPSLALAAGSYSTALDAQTRARVGTSTAGAIDAKLDPEIQLMKADANQKEQHARLTSAQTVSELKRPALIDAETSATSANSAYIRQKMMTELENTKKTKIEQMVLSGQLNLQKLEGAVKESQIALNAASANKLATASELDVANKNLAEMKAILQDPEVRSVLENPKLHETAASAGAVSKIAAPLHDLLRSVSSFVRGGTTVNKTYNIQKGN